MDKNAADIFHKLRITIVAKSAFHRRRTELYRGEIEAPTIGISLAQEWDEKLNSVLEWPRIGIDNLWAHTKWDAFRNDDFGATRLLYYCNADPVISSAIKQSMIAACSFVSVMPGGTNQTPVVYTAYTGGEATGIFNSSTGDLDYGLAAYRYGNGNKITEWLLFAPGVTYKLDAAGREISRQEHGTKDVLLVPYTYNQDLAANPFGESRINKGSISALESGERTLKRIEIASEFYAMPNYFLFLNGSPEDVANSEMVSRWGRLQTVYNEAAGGENPTIQSLGGNSPKDLMDQLKMYAGNYAAAQFMPAAAYGAEPANGSYSYGTSQLNERPYNLILETCKESYGRSIKKMALLSFAVLGIEITSDLASIVPEWVEQPKLDLGQIGDAFVKFGVDPAAVGFDVNDFIRKQLAIPLRNSLLDAPLPAAANARALQAAADDFKSELFDENGQLTFTVKNSQLYTSKD